MVNFKLGNKNVDLNKLFEGLSLDKRNLFLKKYDTNGDKNLEFDKLYDKYPEVGETSFFDSESGEKTLQLMEEYPVFVEQNNITMDNFHEMETLIYQKMSDLGIHDSDWDRVMKLIKNRYHQDVISNDARVKEINSKWTK